MKITDPLGRATERFYDAAGRLLKETDPAGHTTRFTYDKVTHSAPLALRRSLRSVRADTCCPIAWRILEDLQHGFDDRVLVLLRSLREWPQHACGITNVAHGMVNRRHTASVATRIVLLVQSANRDHGLATCFSGVTPRETWASTCRSR